MSSRLTVLVLVALVAGTASMTNPTPGLAAVLAIPLVRGDTSCELVCDGAGCPTGWHDAWEPYAVDPDAQRGAGAHEPTPVCYSGTCEDKHPPCEMSFAGADMEALRVALVAGKMTAASGMLHLHAESLSLNVARSAIQVTSCTGSVIGHFPLHPAMARRLNQELRRIASRGASSPGLRG
jgi:hypothetical protein